MVKFNNTSDQFQAELKNDIDNIKKYPDILVFANKKSNIYKINTKAAKNNKSNKQWKHQVIWFNPPCNLRQKSCHKCRQNFLKPIR